jgi:hypothetical protein
MSAFPNDESFWAVAPFSPVVKSPDFVALFPIAKQSFDVHNLISGATEIAEEGRVMTALMREIEKQARLLSIEERELLAERLMATASGAPLTDLDAVWLEEAERRYSLWKSGQTKGVAAEDALADIRRDLRK